MKNVFLKQSKKIKKKKYTCRRCGKNRITVTNEFDNIPGKKSSHNNIYVCNDCGYRGVPSEMIKASNNIFIKESQALSVSETSASDKENLGNGLYSPDYTQPPLYPTGIKVDRDGNSTLGEQIIPEDNEPIILDNQGIGTVNGIECASTTENGKIVYRRLIKDTSGETQEETSKKEALGIALENDGTPGVYDAAMGKISKNTGEGIMLKAKNTNPFIKETNTPTYASSNPFIKEAREHKLTNVQKEDNDISGPNNGVSMVSPSFNYDKAIENNVDVWKTYNWNTTFAPTDRLEYRHSPDPREFMPGYKEWHDREVDKYYDGWLDDHIENSGGKIIGSNTERTMNLDGDQRALDIKDFTTEKYLEQRHEYTQVEANGKVYFAKKANIKAFSKFSDKMNETDFNNTINEMVSVFQKEERSNVIAALINTFKVAKKENKEGKEDGNSDFLDILKPEINPKRGEGDSQGGTSQYLSSNTSCSCDKKKRLTREATKGEFWFQPVQTKNTRTNK